MGTIVWGIAINSNCTSCGDMGGYSGHDKVTRSSDPNFQVGEVLCAACIKARTSSPGSQA